MTPLQAIAFAFLLTLVVILSIVILPFGNIDMTNEQLLNTLVAGCGCGLVGIWLLYIERKKQTI